VSRAALQLLAEVRACRLCEDELEPRPVLQLHPSARLLIVGQAPGARVHATGVPFNDPSGERLRDWLGLGRERFYDERLVALLPMGFCYPGKGRGGDLPPPPRCARSWRSALLAQLPRVELTVLVGRYAIAWHLRPPRSEALADTVRRWRDYAPERLPLPHPSPRNNRWLRERPWFEADVLPYLRERVAALFP